MFNLGGPKSQYELFWKPDGNSVILDSTSSRTYTFKSIGWGYIDNTTTTEFIQGLGYDQMNTTIQFALDFVGLGLP